MGPYTGEKPSMSVVPIEVLCTSTINVSELNHREQGKLKKMGKLIRELNWILVVGDHQICPHGRMIMRISAPAIVGQSDRRIRIIIL